MREFLQGKLGKNVLKYFEQIYMEFILADNVLFENWQNHAFSPPSDMGLPIGYCVKFFIEKFQVINAAGIMQLKFL